jgi:hypothetical protein
MGKTNTGLFIADNDSWTVFANIMDNRVVFRLYSVTGDDIMDIKAAMPHVFAMLKPGFTVLTDLTAFEALDEYVPPAIASVQEELANAGMGQVARIKSVSCNVERLKNQMKDGFFTSFIAGENFLNEWRRENGVS